MYGITVKQKKALKNAVVKYVNEKGTYPDAYDLPEFDDIGDMNPCEVYWSHAVRYVDDLKNEPIFDDVWRTLRW